MDLRLIPFLMAILYGGIRGGLIAYLLIITYRLFLGGGIPFYSALFVASVLFIVIPVVTSKYHNYPLLRKLKVSISISLFAYTLGYLSLYAYFRVNHQFEALKAYNPLIFTTVGISFVLSMVIMVLLMENLLENQKIREQNRRLVENSQDLIGIICDSNWVYVNLKGLQLLGCTSIRELSGRPIYEFLQVSDHKQCQAMFEDVIRNKKSVGPIEFGWVSIDRQLIQTEVICNPYTFEAKPAIQIVIRDITSRKKADELLKESEQRYRSIVDYHPDLIAWFDINAQLRSINPFGEKLVGISAEQLIGKTCNHFFDSENKERTKRLFQLALQGSPQNFDVTFKRPDSKYVNLNVTFIPIVVKERIVGVYVIAKDTTLQKQLWDKLYESEERYRSLVEESPEAIFVTQKGMIQYVNQTGIKLLGGAERESIIGKRAISFIHPEYRESLKQQISQVSQGKAVDIIDQKCVRMDGEQLDVELKAIPTFFNGESATHIVLNDVTELRKSQEYIQQSEKLHVVGQLAAGIAHEIRNPLTSLRGFVQLIQHESHTNPEFLSIMLSEIDRINTIVGELLLLAKPKKMDFETKELISIVREVSALLEPQALLHNIEFVTKVDTPEIYVYCEENKLKQVFINIIKNAMESMSTGGRVYFHITQSNDKVSIRIIDQGCGIPKHQLPKIGQAFYTSKEKGTGLGIMISYSIINNHQGTITIDSEENIGTVVEVMLPVVDNPTISREEIELVSN